MRIVPLLPLTPTLVLVHTSFLQETPEQVGNDCAPCWNRA